MSALSDSGLVQELVEVRRRVARLEARAAALLGEAERRGIPEEEGFGSSAGWLMAVSGDPAAVCRSRVQVARSLRFMPLTGRAFASGDLSECRTRALVAAREAAPGTFARDEELLVSQARALPSRAFPVALAHWRRLADPDGALRDADRAFERRRLWVSPTWEGMVRLDGDLDPESGAVLLTALASLTDPQAADPTDGRSPSQRRADALTEICRRHLDSSDRATVGGERPHLLVSVDLETLEGRAGRLADLDTGPINLEAVQRLACDADVSRIITRGGSEPLEAGRRSRVIPAPLRRALNHRDGGCTHPGCDTPARWCDAHHLTHWAEGGPTSLANLRLFRRHHRAAHHHRE